jgi:hypothetical protein
MRLFTLCTVTLFVLLLNACANQPTKSASASNASQPNSQSSLQTNYQSPCLQIALQNKNSAMLLGYGSGKTVSEAKQQALYDIANQIEVDVSGESTSKSKKINNTVNTEFSQKVKTRATALLSSVEIACSDINDPSGQYHFTLRYDQRDLVDILADKLIESFWQGKPAKINWQGPALIVQSDFIKQINRQLIDKKSSQQLSIQIKLFRKDNAWYLALNQVTTRIKEKHFAQLLNWNALTTANIAIDLHNEFGKTISTHMQEGNEFRFLVKAKHSGYLSVFDIYEDGRVTKIRDNMPIDKILTLPEHQGSFSAGLLVPNQSTRDQYVFLISKEKIDTAAFRQLMVEEDSTQDQKNYTLSLFLYWLDQQAILASATLQIETVPR